MSRVSRILLSRVLLALILTLCASLTTGCFTIACHPQSVADNSCS